MAGELKLTYLGSASTTNLVGLVQNTSGQFWNTNSQAFETFTAGNIAYYAAVTFAQVSTSPEYLGSFPAAIAAAGLYRTTVYLKAGTSLALTDLTTRTWQGAANTEWKGTAELSNAADINVAVSNAVSQATTAATQATSAATTSTSNATAIAALPSAATIASASATAILATPANKLATDGTGKVGANNLPATVTIGGYASGEDPATLLNSGVNLSSAALTAIETALTNLGVPSAATVAAAVLTTQMTESYAAQGIAPTLAQALFATLSTIGQYRVAGTTITTYKLDGQTVAQTFAMDNSTAPTQRIRAS